MEETRKSLLLALKEIERQKDIELFNLWRQSILNELEFLSKYSLEATGWEFWAIRERIDFLKSMLHPIWGKAAYLFFKASIRHKRIIEIYILEVDKQREINTRYQSPFFGFYRNLEV